jgi:hypothetical protein
VRIGITGHSDLSPDTLALVADALRSALAGIRRPIIGVSCLARGADQVFARVVLELGGEIEVVLPASADRERKVDDLIGRAGTVTTVPFETSDRDAYLAASDAVLTTGVDAVIAVWDGQPSVGRCGTSEVVAAARDRGLLVAVIWPAGAARG